MKNIINISKVIINKKWISLGFDIGRYQELEYGPYASEISLKIHLFIIHIRLGIAYNRGIFKTK